MVLSAKSLTLLLCSLPILLFGGAHALDESHGLVTRGHHKNKISRDAYNLTNDGSVVFVSDCKKEKKKRIDCDLSIRAANTSYWNERGICVMYAFGDLEQLGIDCVERKTLPESCYEGFPYTQCNEQGTAWLGTQSCLRNMSSYGTLFLGEGFHIYNSIAMTRKVQVPTKKHKKIGSIVLISKGSSGDFTPFCSETIVV